MAKADDDAGMVTKPLVPTIILVCAALACLAGEGMRMVSGWPAINADYSPNPIVAGPGDELTLQVGKSFESIKGYWRSRADACEVTVLDDSEVGHDDHITITPNSNSWGNTISVKGSANETARPNATITIPDKDEYAGKTLKIRVGMTITYPKMFGSSSFTNSTDDVEQEYTIPLGPAGSGSTYNMMWNMGMGTALLLFAVVGGMTAYRWGTLREHESETWPIEEGGQNEDEPQA